VSATTRAHRLCTTAGCSQPAGHSTPCDTAAKPVLDLLMTRDGNTHLAPEGRQALCGARTHHLTGIVAAGQSSCATCNALSVALAIDAGYTPGCPTCNPEGKPGGGSAKCDTCGGTGQA